MKYYYEQRTDSRGNLKFIGPGTLNYKYKSHFHQVVELFCIRRGSYEVTINGKSLSLKSGDVLLCYTYDVHSLDTPGEDLDALCLQIPTEFATSFFNRHEGERPTSPVISNEDLVDQIFSIVDEFITKLNTPREVQKNAVSLIFSLIEKHVTFTTTSSKGENGFVRDLLLYIEKNLSQDLSLPTISKNLGYSVAHISRTFNKFLKTNITDYVNRLRYNKVQFAIENSNVKITQAIFNAGFKSVQTYYRIKAKIKEEQSQDN